MRALVHFMGVLMSTSWVSKFRQETKVQLCTAQSDASTFNDLILAVCADLSRKSNTEIYYDSAFIFSSFSFSIYLDICYFEIPLLFNLLCTTSRRFSLCLQDLKQLTRQQKVATQGWTLKPCTSFTPPDSMSAAPISRLAKASQLSWRS